MTMWDATMNTSLICFGLLCALAVILAGCTGIGDGNQGTPTQTPTYTPSGTPVPVGHYVFTEEQNGATVEMNKSSTITLKLPENPTTGYSWQLNVTPGLTITNDTYVPAQTSGNIVGAGGTHVWELIASSTGSQSIQGIYKRPWEPVMGNETTFTMTIIVK